MAINRVRVALTGFPGGPGVSTFYCNNVVTFRAAIHTFYEGLSSLRPADVTATVETTGDILDPVSGNLTGTWVDAPLTALPGFGTGAYAAPAGVVINWLTGSVIDGHRLRGRTFYVPLAANAYDLTGSIAAAELTTIRGASTDLVNSTTGNFLVWHRPRPITDPKGARAGGFAAVTGSVVNDRVAVLRSRRD